MRSEFRGWLPARLREASQDCLWRYAGNIPFTAPFFEETLSRCMSLPENSSGPPRISSLDTLLELANECDALEPSAFVFHVSRCGSTLATQLLGLDEQCVTLSEVPFFDQLLRSRYRPRLAEIVDVPKHLPAAIRLHGGRRIGVERSLIVKLDSWHAAFSGELRSMYPQTPFILLYREPQAVLLSHRRKPGMHAAPGVIENELFGFDAGAAPSAGLAGHLPRVLAFFYRSFLDTARRDSRTMLAHYQPDMIPVVESIAAFAGINLTSGHLEKMRRRAAFHGKHPEVPFCGEPDDPLIEDHLDVCREAYEALDQWRIREAKKLPGH